MPDSTSRRCCSTPSSPQPKRRGLNLLGVARADGVEPVGEDQAGLQQVQIAEELHLLPVEVFPVQPGQQHVPVPEHALIGHVVDREQRADLLVAGHAAVLDLQIGRDQPRLPVVGSAARRRADRAAGSLRAPPGRRTRTARSCRVVLAAVLIEARRDRSTGLLDQVDRHRAARQMALQKAARDRLAADGHVEVDAGRLDRHAGNCGPGDRPAGSGSRSWPSRSSSTGSAPQTSASPPVLANGTASLVAIRIFTRALSVRAAQSADWGPKSIHVLGAMHFHPPKLYPAPQVRWPPHLSG